MKKKLYCYSYEDFNKVCEMNGYNDLNHPENMAFISIACTDTVCCDEPHWFKENHDNVLNVEFDDFSPASYNDDFDYDNAKDDDFIVCGAKALNWEIAQQIYEFIEKNQDKNFMIHCSAGKSRSQGIVRYILDMYGEEETWMTNPNNPCLYPNPHVVVMMKRTFYKNLK